MLFYIKGNDRVYFINILKSGDTESDSLDIKDYLLPSNIPYWTAGENDDIVVAMYANTMANYIRYGDYFNVKTFSQKSLIREVFPKIKEKLQGLGFIKDEKMPNGLFVAKGNEVFRITTEGCVYDEGESFVIGYYAYEALGALKATEGLQIKERIAKVVKTVADACGFTAYPIAITDTVTRKVKVVKSERELDKAIKQNNKKLSNKEEL